MTLEELQKVKDSLEELIADPEIDFGPAYEMAKRRQQESLRIVQQAIKNAQPPVPRCRCCGTTKNLHADNGSGGPWRCDSLDCMVF